MSERFKALLFSSIVQLGLLSAKKTYELVIKRFFKERIPEVKEVFKHEQVLYLQFVEFYLEEIGEPQLNALLKGHPTDHAKFVKGLMLDQI